MQKMSGDNPGYKFINSARSRFDLLRGGNARSRIGSLISLVIAALIVWAWQIVSQPGHGRADITSTTPVSDGTSIDSNVSTQSGVQDSADDGSSISVQKNSDGSTSMVVNGRPINVPAGSSLHKTITDQNGNTNVDVVNGSVNSSNGSSQNVSVFSTTNTNSFSSSNGQINSYNSSSTTGGGSTQN